MNEILNKHTHICAYCGEEYIAAKPFSHIIPRQFFKRFKEGINNKESYSTYFKRTTQREPMEFLLCHKCEQVFGKWESDFGYKILSKVYQNPIPKQLNIDKNIKLAALSILWRVIHCWVTSVNGMNGSLDAENIAFIKQYESRWLKILQKEAELSREEANIFLIPIDCVKDTYTCVQNYKKYPGIMADVAFHDQGDGKGYYCVRALLHKIIVFAYLTPAYSIPRRFSIHNEAIILQKEYMPFPIILMFEDYSNDARNI